MRKLAVLICLFTLAACGQPAAPNNGQTAPSDNNGSVLLSTPQGLPDWLLVLRLRDGGTVYFNQRTITREANLANIWLEIRYGEPQVWDASDATTQRLIRYEVERMHYRFNCSDETFMIVERQIMGANEEVVARDNPTAPFRGTPQTGVARRMLPVACRGA